MYHINNGGIVEYWFKYLERYSSLLIYQYGIFHYLLYLVVRKINKEIRAQVIKYTIENNMRAKIILAKYHTGIKLHIQIIFL